MSIYLLSQFTYWHSCVSVLSIVLLLHAFISNGNLFKNGAAECDDICKPYGLNRIKIIFFSVFHGHKHTMLLLL